MMEKLDMTAIVLTYNEEIHIARCIENLSQFCKRIIIVDSHSKDKTAELSLALGAEVIQHDWPGNQATQFNWALDNLQIDTEWIIRLDADEYLLPELINELRVKIPQHPNTISAISLWRGRVFMGRQLRHNSVNDVSIVRIFRKGKARYENRVMDEHLVILEGDTVEMEHEFVDDNRLSIDSFIQKHNNYASREAALQLEAEYGFGEHTDGDDYGDEVEKKRSKKDRYARMPLFKRSFFYFIYRYIFKGGFRDGAEGFCWDFFQGWWYRALVDAKIYEAKKACGNDRDKLKTYIRDVLKVRI